MDNGTQNTAPLLAISHKSLEREYLPDETVTFILTLSGVPSGCDGASVEIDLGFADGTSPLERMGGAVLYENGIYRGAVVPEEKTGGFGFRLWLPDIPNATDTRFLVVYTARVRADAPVNAGAIISNTAKASAGSVTVCSTAKVAAAEYTAVSACRTTANRKDGGYMDIVIMNAGNIQAHDVSAVGVLPDGADVTAVTVCGRALAVREYNYVGFVVTVTGLTVPAANFADGKTEPGLCTVHIEYIRPQT